MTGENAIGASQVELSEILSLMRQKFAELLGERLKSIYLYGSRARGDSQLDSDLDIFIEVSELTPELRRQISLIAWEVGFETGVVISTFVATTQSMRDGPMAAHPILKAIQYEGIAV